jgi:hypothetical protein
MLSPTLERWVEAAQDVTVVYESPVARFSYLVPELCLGTSCKCCITQGEAAWGERAVPSQSLGPRGGGVTVG